MKRRWAALFLCMAMSAMVLTYTGCGSKDRPATEAETAEETKKEPEVLENSEIADNTEEAEPIEEAETSEVAEPEVEAEIEAEVEERELTEDQKGWTEVSFATIEEFISYDQMQQQIESMKSGLEASEMDIEIVSEDNKLIYRFTYLEQSKTDGMKEALQAQLTSQESTYKAIAKTLQAAVDVENPVVVVTYIDAEGAVIHSQEFSATVGRNSF